MKELKKSRVVGRVGDKLAVSLLQCSKLLSDVNISIKRIPGFENVFFDTEINVDPLSLDQEGLKEIESQIVKKYSPIYNNIYGNLSINTYMNELIAKIKLQYNYKTNHIKSISVTSVSDTGNSDCIDYTHKDLGLILGKLDSINFNIDCCTYILYFKNDNDLVNNITRLTNIIADKDSSIFREFNSKYAEDVNDIFAKFYRV